MNPFVKWFLQFFKPALENTCLPKIFWDDNIILITGLISTEVYKGKREGGGVIPKKAVKQVLCHLKKRGRKGGKGRHITDECYI